MKKVIYLSSVFKPVAAEIRNAVGQTGLSLRAFHDDSKHLLCQVYEKLLQLFLQERASVSCPARSQGLPIETLPKLLRASSKTRGGRAAKKGV